MMVKDRIANLVRRSRHEDMSEFGQYLGEIGKWQIAIK